MAGYSGTIQSRALQSGMRGRRMRNRHEKRNRCCHRSDLRHSGHRVRIASGNPIIDMQGVDESALEIDWAECEAYSEEVIIAKGAAKGAAGGAVAGAAAGAIGGNAESGAGYGAIWGATRSTIHGDREKQGVFKRCMRGRGYRVLN